MRLHELPPMVGCTGCGECCTVVQARPKEAKAIRQYLRDSGETWVVPTEPNHSTDCGFLRRDEDGTYRCGVYPARPFACRLFGVAREMSCRYVPEAAVISLSPLDAVVQRVMDPQDKTLGELFEPGYFKRLGVSIDGAVDPKDQLGRKTEAEVARRRR